MDGFRNSAHRLLQKNLVNSTGNALKIIYRLFAASFSVGFDSLTVAGLSWPEITGTPVHFESAVENIAFNTRLELKFKHAPCMHRTPYAAVDDDVICMRSASYRRTLRNDKNARLILMGAYVSHQRTIDPQTIGKPDIT